LLSLHEFLFFFLSFLDLILSLQLKGEYKVVKTLRGLSGFGWDEGNQMVTAPMAVWAAYVKVHRSHFRLLSSIKTILTINPTVSQQGQEIYHQAFPTL